MRIEQENRNAAMENDRPREDRLQKQQKKKKKGRGPYILGMLGCLAVLILVMYAGTALYVWVDEGIASNTNDAAVAAGIVEEPVTYSQEELDAAVAQASETARTEAAAQEQERILGGIRESLSNGNTTVETLRPYYPGELVLASNGQICFVPIRDDWKKHSLVQENIVQEENGRLAYVQDGQTVSHMGIDVSQHQGKIDWEQAAADGVEFAFIRVGFRGYGTGKLVADEQFENNIKGALKNGIKAGVYFFSQAVTEEEVLEEAAFVLEQIAPYQVQCPVVFDVEKVADSSGRMNQLSVEERTALTLTFCRTIEQAGYQPMIYHNMEMGALMLDLGQLEEYDKWFAYYGTDTYYPYAYDVWQYSDKGTVAGIDGAVDLNISFRMWE